MKTTHDKIEIRSKKIRELIGHMPGGIVRYGTYIIILIFILIFAVLYYLSTSKPDSESIVDYLLRI